MIGKYLRFWLIYSMILFVIAYLDIVFACIKMLESLYNKLGTLGTVIERNEEQEKGVDTFFCF